MATVYFNPVKQKYVKPRQVGGKDGTTYSTPSVPVLRGHTTHPYHEWQIIHSGRYILFLDDEPVRMVDNLSDLIGELASLKDDSKDTDRPE